MKFFRDRGSTDYGAALQHEGLETFFREVEGGDECVVPTANDHDIARWGHGYFSPRSFRISSAANRPFAPMMPPPGCVAEPHIYKFLMGVRYRAQPATGRRKKSCSSESSPWKMLPSLRPHSRSRSSGVTTCLWRMMSLMFGAYSAMVL